MKSTLVASLLAIATSTALAQYTNQTAPFNLVVLSKNETYNGTTLLACHEGAGIEGLCLTSTLTGTGLTGSTFNFNTSTYGQYNLNPAIGEQGYLTYLLRGGNFNESEAFSLYYSATSNVALPLFEGTQGTLVAFDEHNLLNIQGYVDDRLPPPYNGTFTAYYRWYACQTYFTGYTYTTLAWVTGKYHPQNPTCEKVKVKRVFI
ncbi:hypothetical protein BP6252_03715 [Coleophoma cylindrospora]|uniref:DUF7907 domain-containing protein n=1 Tax=Coleophoma cylindrospora TaxID=1849047 RepID=A0A3D8S8J1_9HELO|nr:hypothetical protein BP6252_03715 [Coleophoma cylindrospora]